MIKLTDIHTIEADNYCFILNTTVPTTQRDGSPGTKVIQTFHDSIPLLCAYALKKHPELRDQTDIQAVADKMQEISNQMVESIKKYSENIQVIKVLSKKERGERNAQEADNDLD